MSQGPWLNKDSAISRTLQRQIYLPRAEGKDPTSLWEMLSFLAYKSGSRFSKYDNAIFPMKFGILQYSYEINISFKNKSGGTRGMAKQ
jgi:hypothetical protein